MRQTDGTDKFAGMLETFKSVCGDDLPKDLTNQFKFDARVQGNDASSATVSGRSTAGGVQRPTEMTGLQSLGELHKTMFRAAVLDIDNPNYKTGLTYLTEALKTAEGLGASKRLVMLYIMEAQCHNGLKDATGTGQAVFKAVRNLRYEIPASEYSKGESAEEFSIWAYSEVAKLDIFEGLSKRRHMWFPPKHLKGMSFEERACVMNALQKGQASLAVRAAMEQEAADLDTINRHAQMMKDIFHSHKAALIAYDPSRDWEEIERNINRLGAR